MNNFWLTRKNSSTHLKTKAIEREIKFIADCFQIGKVLSEKEGMSDKEYQTAMIEWLNCRYTDNKEYYNFIRMVSIRRLFVYCLKRAKNV